MNNKGQAFIESMLLLGVITISAIFLIRLGLHLQNEILIDELIEEALVCKLQKKDFCVSRLKKQFLEMNFYSVKITDKSHFNTAQLAVEIDSGLNIKTQLESEMSLELSID